MQVGELAGASPNGRLMARCARGRGLERRRRASQRFGSPRRACQPAPARTVCCSACSRHGSRPWRSLTSGCTLCVAGGYQKLPLKLLSMAATWQRLAAAWRRAGARGARRGAIVVGACTGAGPHSSRSGRLWIVEPAALGCLAGPPGHTTELGDLWSPCESSRVSV